MSKHTVWLIEYRRGSSTWEIDRSESPSFSETVGRSTAASLNRMLDVNRYRCRAYVPRDAKPKKRKAVKRGK